MRFRGQLADLADSAELAAVHSVDVKANTSQIVEELRHVQDWLAWIHEDLCTSRHGDEE